MLNTKILKILNLFSTLAVFIINSLANILPLNNINTGQVSDNYPNLFTPAGLTFSIWGLIYFLQILFIIHQFKLNDESEILKKIGVFYTLSNVCNFLWLFAWHWEIIWLSLILIIGLLLCLGTIHVRLGIGTKNLTNTDFSTKICIYSTISMYFGWVTVATIANFTIFFIDLGWYGPFLTEPVWAIIIIIIGLMIGIIMVWTKSDVIYAAVLIWAFIGIAIKRIGGTNNLNPEVGLGAIGAIAILSLFSIIILIKKRKK